MTSGGQCVMTTGTALMLLWSANSWDMHTQEVSIYHTHQYYHTLKLKVGFVNYNSNLPVHAAGRALSNAHFGIGRGQILLDDVQCTSSSNQLLECPSRPILSHNCLHSADAGVSCEGILDRLKCALELPTQSLLSFCV